MSYTASTKGRTVPRSFMHRGLHCSWRYEITWNESHASFRFFNDGTHGALKGIKRSMGQQLCPRGTSQYLQWNVTMKIALTKFEENLSTYTVVKKYFLQTRII